ncbi:unnamed protein product [Aspergillus oryzae]|nr:unnamed protein product [Aspergillus oryzae]
MAATRTSTRQAAQKAKEAISAGPDTKSKGGAGAKRKEAAHKGPEPKRSKKDDKKAARDEDKKVEERKEDAEKHVKEKKEEHGEQEAEGEKAQPVEEQVEGEKAQSNEKPEVEEKGQQNEEPAEGKKEEPGEEQAVGPKEEQKDEQVEESKEEHGNDKKDSQESKTEQAKSADGNNSCTCFKWHNTDDADMGFVEKAGQTMKELQENFIAGEKYETSTRGERTVPEAKPYAEGVYAITSTKRASHLAYILTIPGEIGPLQEDFGLHARGSWIVQSKNPKYPGPSSAQLPKDPEYPERFVQFHLSSLNSRLTLLGSVREKFQDYRWAPLTPEFIDYPNAQFLMIGEATDDLGKAATAESDGKRSEEVQPGEELEKLEGENEERVDSLKGKGTMGSMLNYVLMFDQVMMLYTKIWGWMRATLGIPSNPVIN